MSIKDTEMTQWAGRVYPFVEVTIVIENVGMLRASQGMKGDVKIMVKDANSCELFDGKDAAFKLEKMKLLMDGSVELVKDTMEQLQAGVNAMNMVDWL